MTTHKLADWWTEAHEQGTWWAPWANVLADLSAEDASWQPAPGRHSIWQIINHIVFWREYFLKRNRGAEPLTMEQVDALNWQDPPEYSEAEWLATRDRFARTQHAIHALLSDPHAPTPPKPELNPRHLLFHDSYHFGQVMYIRALLGKPGLES